MAGLSLAVALPIASLVAYLTHARFESDIQQSGRKFAPPARITAYETSRFVRRMQTLLATLARSPAVAALDPARCEPWVADYRATVEQAANLLTLDADGSLVCSAIRSTATVARGPDPAFYFARAKQSKAFTVGAPALGYLSHRWVVTMAQPILDEDGRFRGVVAIAIDLLQLAQTRLIRDVPDGGATGVVHADGTLLWSLPDPAEVRRLEVRRQYQDR